MPRNLTLGMTWGSLGTVPASNLCPEPTCRRLGQASRPYAAGSLTPRLPPLRVTDQHIQRLENVGLVGFREFLELLGPSQDLQSRRDRRPTDTLLPAQQLVHAHAKHIRKPDQHLSVQSGPPAFVFRDDALPDIDDLREPRLGETPFNPHLRQPFTRRQRSTGPPLLLPRSVWHAHSLHPHRSIT